MWNQPPERRKAAPRLLFVVMVFGSSFWVSTSASHADGTQSGVLAGRVLDPDGQALPGVAVELTGATLSRSAVTDDRGSFRFPALEPGPYHVLADLLGLQGRQHGVRVFIDKTTTIEIVLGEQEAEASSMAEAIQIVAEAPIVDGSAIRIGGSLSRDFLDELPVERFYQSVALVLPGVSGGEDGNPSVGGALRSSNLYLVDGVDTSDPTTGLFGLNLPFDSLQSVDVTTSTLPAEYGRASGAVINVVTRSGGSHWQGRARWSSTSEDWGSDLRRPSDGDEHLASQVDAANRGIGGVDPTFSLVLGGPVLPERLFFFGGFESGEHSSAAPTLGEELWNSGAQQDARVLKLTYAAGSNLTWVAQQTADASDAAAFRPFDSQPGENLLGPAPLPLGDSFVDRLPGDLTALQGRRQEGSFTRVRGDWVVDQNFFLRLGLAKQDRTLERAIHRVSGITASSPHIGVTEIAFDPDSGEEPEIVGFALFNGPSEVGSEDRSRLQLEAGGDYFLRLGSTEQEIRAGIDFQRTRSEIDLTIPGADSRDRFSGLPSGGQIFVDLDPDPACLIDGQCHPFDSESGTFFPFLLLDFEDRPPTRTEVETLSLFVADTLSWRRLLLSAGLRFETLRASATGSGSVLRDHGFSPRLGLSWQSPFPGVLLSASWSRYLEAFPQQMIDAFFRSDLFSGFTEYTWDAGREACIGADAGEIDSECWIPTGGEGIAPLQPASPSPYLRRSTVDEWTLGFERQISPATGLSLFLVRRRWHDLWDNRLEALFTESGDFRGVGGRVENLPEARRRYRAVELLLQRRFQKHWQMMASYTWSRTEGNLFTADGLDTFADFSALSDANLVQRFGLAPFDRTHRVRAYLSYHLGIGKSDLIVGSALRYESGLPWQLERLDELGVRFLTPRGSERLGDVFQWDLSATGRVPVGRIEMELEAEVFNVTDEQEILGVETLVDSGIAGRPRGLNDLQSPRSYRLSAAFRF